MKKIEEKDMDGIKGTRLYDSDTFTFECRKDLACFNRCCRNLNLFLYPYDIIRLKKHLGISASEFIDQYTEVVMRPGNYFPDVLLTMSSDDEKSCIFLREAGCLVYNSRPYSCRTFPTEHGLHVDVESGKKTLVHLFRPPDFCEGKHQPKVRTVEEWFQDQGTNFYYKMVARWSEVKQMFEQNPWGPEGPEGRRAKMAFMAAYNMDVFSEFVFKSSFLKRYRVQSAQRKLMKKDETELMLFGFEWIKLFIFGIKGPKIR